VNAQVLSLIRAVCVAATTMLVVFQQGRMAAAQDPAATRPNTAPPLRVTLADAVQRALANSFRVGEGLAREAAAQASADARSVAAMPTVNLLGGYTRTNHVDEFAITAPGAPPRVIYPDVPDNWRARLDVLWPVYTSGRVGALSRAATADVSAAERDVSTVRADVRLDATRAFWTLAMANEAVDVVEESLQRVESHLRDVRIMREVGLLAPNDVLSVEARRSRERVLLIDARNARDVADADLRRVTGLPFDVTIELAPEAAGIAGPLPTVPDLVSEARAKRPERQALELRIQAWGDRGTAAAAGQRPTVAVVGGADYARPNPRIFPRAATWNPSFDMGLNVAWNVWDGGRVHAEVAEVAANRRAAEQRLAEFDRVLDFDIRQRRLDLEAARAAVEAATDGLTSATEAHRVVIDRFKAGLVSNSEVMDAQVALMQSHLDRTRATTAVHLAWARLERALGR
jgi:outer membrane protein